LKTLALAASIAAAAAFATTAHAATFITWAPPAPDGSITATYGNTGVTDTDFSDIFDFMLPTGFASFTISSTFVNNPVNDINFTSVAFNGQEYHIDSTGVNEVRTLNGVHVTSGGMQHLVVTGTSGGGGSYDGVISFTPDVGGGVPEPAAWALMILGFGGTGALLRFRRVATTA
jgi:hypothetical protein